MRKSIKNSDSVLWASINECLVLFEVFRVLRFTQFDYPRRSALGKTVTSTTPVYSEFMLNTRPKTTPISAQVRSSVSKIPYTSSPYPHRTRNPTPRQFGIRSVSVTMLPGLQKNSLPFLSLLSQFGSLPASHNRQVEGLGGPVKSFWAHHLINFYRFSIGKSIRLL